MSFFSQISNNIKNRRHEISVIIENLVKKPVYTVLSFPAEFSFERELYKKIKTPLIVYNVQSQHNITYSRQFIKDTGNMVFVPLGKYKKINKLKGKKSFRLSDFLTLSDFYFGNVKLTRGDVFNVKEMAPDKFDIIDLDYIDSFNIDNFGAMLAIFNEKMMPGSILCVTLNIHYYRTSHRIHKKRSKEWGTDPSTEKLLNQFTYDSLNSKRFPINKYFKNPEKILKFGVKQDKLKKYINLANNIIDIIAKKINKRPIYANIYKGGINPQYGPNMLRLVFKK
jgi:hypothetical protein